MEMNNDSPEAEEKLGPVVAGRCEEKAEKSKDAGLLSFLTVRGFVRQFKN